MGNSSSDVTVIGGGVVGLAAATTMAASGLDVICLERARPGDGQSAGRTRQFRHLHADAELVELAVRARKGWRRWEAVFERTLVGDEGALRAGASGEELDRLRHAGVPAVAVDPEATAELFPVAARFDGMWLFDPAAGAIRAAETIDALAGALGSRLRRAEVDRLTIDPAGESVQLQTTDGTHLTGCCVVCAGAGTDRLVRPLGLKVHQDRQAHLRLAFRTRAHPSRPLPCFSDRRETSPEVVYGLSDLEDRFAVGLATVTTYPAVDDLASDVPAGADVSSQRERILNYVRETLPGLDPEPVDAVLRLTTTLPKYPDDGFELCREGPVIALAGPNIFKFAPVISERLTAEVTREPLREVVSSGWT
jgi:sarcosine oxidase